MRFYGVIILAISAISMASVLIKLCAAPAIVIAFYRLVLASLFFVLLFCLRKPQSDQLFSAGNIMRLLLAGVFLSAHFVAWITSLEFTSVASSVVLLATAPVFVGLGSAVLFGERPTIWLVLGLVASVAGSGIIGFLHTEQEVGADPVRGNILAAVGALGLAGYFLAGKQLRARFDTLTYVTVVYSIAAVVLFVVVMLTQFRITGYSNQTYLLLFAIALVPQVIGHTSLNWALRHVSASAVAIISLGEPVGAPILAYFLLREKITAIQMIGGILILTGVVLSLQGEFRTPLPKAPAAS